MGRIFAMKALFLLVLLVIVSEGKQLQHKSKSTHLVHAAEEEEEGDRFAECMKFVFAREGGYVNDPDDSGGETNLGVTKRTYEAYCTKKGITPKNMHSLTHDDVLPIYRENFWNVVHGNDLPAGLDLCVFDFAVNAGPGRAIKKLQGLLNVGVDGGIGPVTLAAIRAIDSDKVDDLIDAYGNLRREYYRSLNKPKFEKGWLNRVDKCTELAKTMIDSTESSHDFLDDVSETANNFLANVKSLAKQVVSYLTPSTTTTAQQNTATHPVSGTTVAPGGTVPCGKAYRRGKELSGVELQCVHVDGALVVVETNTAFQVMKAAASAAHLELKVSSGFRTMERQTRLYNCYKQKTGTTCPSGCSSCNLAAKPGYSNHQNGIALDLNVKPTGVYDWLSRNAHKYGFVRTVASEQWHWEYRPTIESCDSIVSYPCESK